MIQPAARRAGVSFLRTESEVRVDCSGLPAAFGGGRTLAGCTEAARPATGRMGANRVPHLHSRSWLAYSPVGCLWLSPSVARNGHNRRLFLSPRDRMSQDAHHSHQVMVVDDHWERTASHRTASCQRQETGRHEACASDQDEPRASVQRIPASFRGGKSVTSGCRE